MRRSQSLVRRCAIGGLWWLCGCSTPAWQSQQRLLSAHLVDQRGMVQTITAGADLKGLERRDFASAQPYRRVLRTFARDSLNRQRGIMTTYHPNGHPMQWLEICDGRAWGAYREWHANGAQRIAASVVGGIPDVTAAAQQSWLFDGTCWARDEGDRLLLEVNYCSGLREGPMTAYWLNGRPRVITPYSRGVLHGQLREFDENGQLILTAVYREGNRCGQSARYWRGGALAAREQFKADRLEAGRYWDRRGALLGEVQNGCGWRWLFLGDEGVEKQWISEGQQLGAVEFYDADGHIARIAHYRSGQLDGKDTRFYPPNGDRPSRPRLEMSWCAGVMQGPVRSWFPDGQLRSYHERVHNRREGCYTCYYQSGNIMLVEEYRRDRLVSGRYFGDGAKSACSQIVEGHGTATLFDDGGRLFRRIEYDGGWPKLEERAPQRSSDWGGEVEITKPQEETEP